MEKCCKNCTWSYGYPGSLYCQWHHDAHNEHIRVRDQAYCKYFSPADSSDEIENNSSSCFLTSACVKYLGLPDNCNELTTLRSFRDTYLLTKDWGTQLVSSYYKIAPKIVEKIEKSPSPAMYYDYIYNTISNCIYEIERKHYEEALVLYKDMVLHLEASLL